MQLIAYYIGMFVCTVGGATIAMLFAVTCVHYWKRKSTAEAIDFVKYQLHKDQFRRWLKRR